MPLARSPSPEVAFACGSRSTTSDALAGLGEARGEVHRGRRLADAALLVRDGVDRRPASAGHSRHASGRSGPSRAGAGSPAASAESWARRPARRGARAGPAELAGPRDDRSRSARRARHRAPRRRPAARAAGTTRRNRRRRERLRDRDAVALRALLLRAAAHDAHVREAGRHRSRNCGLRPFGSSSVTSRSGSAAASGIPGAPPPEPTSTIGPSKPLEDGNCARGVLHEHRAGPRPVADRGQARAWRAGGSSQRSSRGSLNRSARRRRSGSARCLRSPSRRRRTSFRRRWMTFRSTAVIGSSSTRSPLATRPSALRRASASRASRPPLAIARRVHDDRLAVTGAAAADDRVREVLDRVDRLRRACRSAGRDLAPEHVAIISSSSSSISTRQRTSMPAPIRSSSSRTSARARSRRRRLVRAARRASSSATMAITRAGA